MLSFKRKREQPPQPRGWIGVDLDGTLALDVGWRGPEYIGEAIPEMLQRVYDWLDAGIEVRIFTARASDPTHIPFVKLWLERYNLHHLEVTNVKDYQMIELWDDRAVQVMHNTGRPIDIYEDPPGAVVNESNA